MGRSEIINCCWFESAVAIGEAVCVCDVNETGVCVGRLSKRRVWKQVCVGRVKQVCVTSVKQVCVTSVKLVCVAFVKLVCVTSMKHVCRR